ncbi:hypothetical protein BDF19DRAFT_410302 [Syncephalis fuscata]|nr:hypothetical protein BDF19DRAFT_410302 [Syncephalis fuscata]
MSLIVDLWSFSLKDVKFDDQLLSHLLSLLPVGESNSIRQYRHIKDQLRSLIGKLLTRCWLVQQFQCAWTDVKVQIGDYGKPMYSITSSTARMISSFDVNVSHHGDWIAFAGIAVDTSINTANDAAWSIGVDIVTTELDTNSYSTTSDALFESLQEQFSLDEQRSICASSTTNPNYKMLALMTRWALKEAVVKALGWGIAHDDLAINGLSFQFTHSDLLPTAKQTTIYHSDIQFDVTNPQLNKNQWQFQLNYIDNHHIMALAIMSTSNSHHSDIALPVHPTTITNQQLLGWINSYTPS